MNLEDSFVEEFFKMLIGNGDYTRVINAIVEISESLKNIDESLQIIADHSDDDDVE